MPQLLKIVYLSQSYLLSYQSHCIYETTVEVSGDSAIDLPMLVRVWSQSSCGSLLGRVGEGLGRSKLRGLYSQGYQIL